MRWMKFPVANRLFFYVIIIVIVCGFIPLLFLHHRTPETGSSVEISNLITKLENEHNEILASIQTLEKIAEDALEQSDKSLLNRSFDSKSDPRVDGLSAEIHHIENSKRIEDVNAVQPDDVTGVLFPELMTYNTPNSRSSSSVLVVGGTDGSGTRRVVQILSQLGVTMVSEDPETYDIHADIIGGWPNVVTPVLEITENISYDPLKLPEPVHSKIAESLGKLLKLADSDSRKLESHILAVGGSLPKPLNVTVSAVKYGFKAPVAMLLAPYWALLLKDFKMLHVLRDGRDIAFSANQGPVEKFFSCMYGKNPVAMGERPEIKAIRLWSDWNAGLKKWAMKKVETYSADVSNSAKSFGYYALHSESIVDPRVDVRYSALSSLATWLGSDISDKDLCCIAVRGSEFLGSHDRTAMDAPNANKLSSRYGKWKKMFKHDEELGRSMVSVGAAGLSEFGYETGSAETKKILPVGEHSDFETLNRNPCTAQPADCSPPMMTQTATLPVAALWGIVGVCTVQSGVDYRGGDLSAFGVSRTETGEPDYTECCRKCKESNECRYFTVDTLALTCYLKLAKESTERTTLTQWLVSGDML